jgi:chromosomal replication initiation ATPase DnaA
MNPTIISQHDRMIAGRIERLWPAHDTLDIARHLGLSEAEVANIMGAARGAGVSSKHRVSDVIAVVSAVSGVTHGEIVGETRRRRVIKARQISMWGARWYGIRSLPQIGRVLHRDHSTVIHGIRRVNGVIISTGGMPDRDMAVTLSWLWHLDWGRP